uniref:NB-ARC domain-containing protein n=1 Tax=Glycine max TaxID=3847 RepID=A0A0R0G0X9_SOYBN
MVGIHGLGGVGKTTLVVTVYNFIAGHFEASCFLGNAKRTSNTIDGLEKLQNNLLSKMVGEIKFTNWREGITIIKRKLKQKKILLILDDVDKHKQLQAITDSPDWFGRGSRVIITTRDENLLVLHNVKITYKVREFNKIHALLLLTHKAFELEKEVDPRYCYFLNRAVTYASDLPLALEIIGSNLFGKSIEESESALNGFERIPDNNIYEILKVSYDALNEDEKSIFLDIACPRYSLCSLWVLVVTLHDLIEDMDKEIVRRESATEPAEQSRLWSREDIKKVLQENKALIITSCLLIYFFFYFLLTLQRLVNLTSLILDECDSLTEISDVSCLSNLEILSFRERRNLFRIHHSVGLLEKLKILDAEGCPELKSFPPLKLTSLESLDLSYCSNLESFPEILGKMENITRLHLIGFSIRKLPPSFRNLTRLKVLYVGTETTPLMDFDVATLISNICMMSELFEIAANSLQWRLWPDDACLQWRLWPDDFLKLTSLLNSSIEFLCHGDLSDELLRLFLSCFVNVINLELKGSKLTVIPECIKECRFLSTPKLNGCDRLQEIRGIPPNLKRFSAIACPDLTSSSISMLLNQELHEAGDTYFSLPIVKIPEWFECQSREPSIFFWFRNEFPAITVCIVDVIINKKHKHKQREIFDSVILILILLEREKFVVQRLGLGKKQRLVGSEVVETQFVEQQQHMGFFLTRVELGTITCNVSLLRQSIIG